MAWTNAFSIGDCELQLYRWFEGEPLLVPESQWASYGVSITAANGIVTVEADLPTGTMFDIYVKPLFDTESKPVRITSLTAQFDSGSGTPRMYAYRDKTAFSEDPAGPIFLTTSNPVQPDPAEFPAYEWLVAGIGVATEFA